MSKSKIFIIVGLLVVAVGGYIAYDKGLIGGSAEEQVYQVKYDSTRDPASDLQFAMAQAQDENKKIFMIVGGDWCPWCRAMDKFIKSHPDIDKKLKDNFITLKTYFGSDKPNKTFLQKFPRFLATPHIFILDKEGNVLHSQGTAQLEKGTSYDALKYRTFVNFWAEKKI